MVFGSRGSLVILASLIFFVHLLTKIRYNSLPSARQEFKVGDHDIRNDIHDNFINNTSFQISSPPPRGLLCDGYQGILHIAGVSATARTGTFFFQDILNGLIFANQHNLYPFIWIDNIDPEHSVYDPRVHGQPMGGVYKLPRGKIENSIQHLVGVCVKEPFKPSFETVTMDEEYEVTGNGIWQSYFEPTPVPFDDPSCVDKPVFQMTRKQIKAMRFCAEWSVQGWSSSNLLPDIRPKARNMTLDEWLYDHRQRAAPLVSKYFRPQPWLRNKIQENNPAVNGNSCLSVHISKSYVQDYLPYIEAYIEAMTSRGDYDATDVTIFLATHEAHVVEDLLKTSNVLQRSMILMQQPQVLQRPGNGEDIFDVFAHQKHRLNGEVLAHVFLLSKCDFMIHGKYIVTEGAMYLNPALHNRSVNVHLPENKRTTPREFADLVRTYYHRQ